MKAIPIRYRDYFQDVRVWFENGTWEMKWKCRRCLKIIAKNTAGARSHLARHVREAEAPGQPEGRP